MRHLSCVGTVLFAPHGAGGASTTAAKKAAPVNFLSVTPNLVVGDIDRSIAFYRDILGFELSESVPEQRPFMFAWMKRGEVSVFLNALQSVKEDYPALVNRALGGTFTMFIVVEGVDTLHALVKDDGRVVMPPKTQFYGMREFAIEDPDGYVITFAERVSQ
jgi:catechol 2,3-dioxygenase-like lactoylglutathione lyase family enzyme